MKNEKLLIAFFSYHGHTRSLAEQIQKIAGGTLYEILPQEPYAEEYNDCRARAKQENSEGANIPLQGTCHDFSRYDTVLLGTPNWFGIVTPPVASFMKQYDFSGKAVLPFCTHGGGGMGHIVANVAEALPSAKVREGMEVQEGSEEESEGKIRAWLQNNGISLDS
ncbi:MAG: flavodoxin [Desulfovibrionaceae bacterium]|nr:flavodoxin [Desulfovibrionaceae bacterium]